MHTCSNSYRIHKVGSKIRENVLFIIHLFAKLLYIYIYIYIYLHTVKKELRPIGIYNNVACFLFILPVISILNGVNIRELIEVSVRILIDRVVIKIYLLYS